MIRTSILALTAVALIGLSCSDDETATTATAPGTSTPQRASPDSGSVVVLVDDMSFSPAQIHVAIGDTVTWDFADRVDHDVEFGDGPASPMARTGSWARTFGEQGTYDYLCSLHPGMTGTVIVS